MITTIEGSKQTSSTESHLENLKITGPEAEPDTETPINIIKLIDWVLKVNCEYESLQQYRELTIKGQKGWEIRQGLLL